MEVSSLVLDRMREDVDTGVTSPPTRAVCRRDSRGQWTDRRNKSGSRHRKVLNALTID